MENREVLKSMIDAIIDEKDADAQQSFHNFVTDKAREYVAQIVADAEIPKTSNQE